MEYSKFQINDCSENFTHEPIVFVYCFEKIYLISLLYEDLRKIYLGLLFHCFFQRNTQKSAIFPI